MMGRGDDCPTPRFTFSWAVRPCYFLWALGSYNNGFAHKGLHCQLNVKHTVRLLTLSGGLGSGGPGLG